MPGVTSISQQLDLAAGGGWSTAWLHERRGRDGKWIKTLGPGLFQDTLPGMPGAHHTVSQELEHRLQADEATGVKHETKPHPKRGMHIDPRAYGMSGLTSIVTFGNGSKWVRKTDGGKLGMDSDQFDAEVLAPRVSDVIGAGAVDAVERKDADGSITLWEPYVQGAKPLAEWMGGVDDRTMQPLIPDNTLAKLQRTNAGIRIGILDTLIGNRDRNLGNVMVRKNKKIGEDEPVPIDHGQASFADMDYNYEFGPFAKYVLHTPGVLPSIPEAQWDRWERGLEALEPEFKSGTSRDHSYDFDQMMINFDALRGLSVFGPEGYSEPAYESYD